MSEYHQMIQNRIKQDKAFANAMLIEAKQLLMEDNDSEIAISILLDLATALVNDKKE